MCVDLVDCDSFRWIFPNYFKILINPKPTPWSILRNQLNINTNEHNLWHNLCFFLDFNKSQDL